MIASEKNITEQTVAELIRQGIIDKELLKQHTIQEITSALRNNLNESNATFSSAMGCVENIRDFVSQPQHILGSLRTKHGEIAERIEVEIRNARSILDRVAPSASIDKDLIGRTSPVDYIIDNIDVQSKFLNSARGSLDAVIEHMNVYPAFPQSAIYHIPKDQYEILLRVANGEKSIDGLSMRSIMALRDKIDIIQKSSGRSFTDLVKPAISKYDEVQLGKVSVTIDGYEKEITDFHKQEVKNIRDDAKAKREEATHITDPSLAEALKYAGIAALISGTISGGITIHSKIKEGKSISEFTIDDWKEVGYDFSVAGVEGGISGLGIYGLTKCVGMSAPFAGAVTSSIVSSSSLYYKYRQGEISESEFSEKLNCLSVEAALSGIGAAIGQGLCPIPVLGAILGTMAAKCSIEILNHIASQEERKLIAKMQSDFMIHKARLDDELRETINDLEQYYNQLGGFIECALSPVPAMQLWSSIQLCNAVNVPESQIIHNISELDNFILN